MEAIVAVSIGGFYILLLLASTVAGFGLQANVDINSGSSRTIKNLRTAPLFMSTWSDSKAIKDYFEFLNSGKQELDWSKDCTSVIIRPEQDATQLSSCLMDMSLGDDLVLHPGMDLPKSIGGSPEYPIYITLPPYEINDFLLNLRDSYKDHMEDFVFFSGGLSHGNIEDILKQRGYCRDTMTQVLISGLHIAPNGKPQDQSVSLRLDSQGEPKTANECAACGKWAGSVAERLHRNKISCAKNFYREWRRKMWERHVLDGCLHLIGIVRDQQPTTLADVANYYSAEASDMVWELSQLLKGWKALTLLYGFEERIFGTAEMIGTEITCTVNDEMFPFIWGNQVFLQSKMFCDYLNYAKIEKGLLPGSDIPQRADDDFASKMRSGILRADGVV